MQHARSGVGRQSIQAVACSLIADLAKCTDKLSRLLQLSAVAPALVKSGIDSAELHRKIDISKHEVQSESGRKAEACSALQAFESAYSPLDFASRRSQPSACSAFRLRRQRSLSSLTLADAQTEISTSRSSRCSRARPKFRTRLLLAPSPSRDSRTRPHRSVLCDDTASKSSISNRTTTRVNFSKISKSKSGKATRMSRKWCYARPKGSSVCLPPI